MKREVIVYGKTVEDAIKKGLRELGVEAEKAEYEVLENAKKGFLGFGETPAKVKVMCEADGSYRAVDFVSTLVKNLQLDAEVTTENTDGKNTRIVISGESAGRSYSIHLTA